MPIAQRLGEVLGFRTPRVGQFHIVQTMRGPRDYGYFSFGAELKSDDLARLSPAVPARVLLELSTILAELMAAELSGGGLSVG